MIADAKDKFISQIPGSLKAELVKRIKSHIVEWNGCMVLLLTTNTPFSSVNSKGANDNQRNLFICPF